MFVEIKRITFFIKLNILSNDSFYLNMYTSFNKLLCGREYYIISNGEKYKGIFDDYKYSYMSGDRDVYAWFYNETFSDFYTDDDDFYDVEEIKKNAQKAIQSMEERSLNMILKRLVNDEFQWS